MMFQDRQDAGRRLAARLLSRRDQRPVLALPRGGVPVGYEIAAALGAPLDDQKRASFPFRRYGSCVRAP